MKKIKDQKKYFSLNNYFNTEFYIFFFLFIFIITLAFNLDQRRALPYLFGDEAVFMMMAQSLAYDRDLQYERKDLKRFYESGFKDGPQGVFLTKRLETPIDYNIFTDFDDYRIFFSGEAQKTKFIQDPDYFLERAYEHNIEFENIMDISEDTLKRTQSHCIVEENIYYSKFLVYPLFVSVFVFLFGDRGFLLFNFLLYFLVLVLSYKYLRKYNSPKVSMIFTLMFFMVSVSTVYTLWITPEIMNMFFVALGFYLFVRYTDNQKLFFLIFSGVFIAIAAASKLPHAVFMISIGLYLLFKFRIKTIFLMIFIFTLVFLSFYGIQYLLTGNYNAYWGDRKTFYWHYPYQEEGNTNWDEGIRLSNIDYFEDSFYFSPKVIFLNMYYYVFGRFTGLLPYYIFSLLAVFIFLFDYGKKHRTYIFLSIFLCIMAYIIMAPDNYQGGGGAVGNRFFISIFPAFIFLVQKIKSLKLPMLFSLIGISFTGIIILSPFAISYSPFLHALSPIYKVLPVEYTLLNTLPTLVNRHTYIVRFDEHIWYRIHKFDVNSLNREYANFWLIADKSDEFAIRIMNDKVLDYGILNIFNGFMKNNIKLDLPSGRIRKDLLPGETQTILFPLEKYYPYFNSRVYPFNFYSSHGFIPRMNGLDLGELNHKNLGFSYSFNFNFSDIAKELLNAGREEEAVKFALKALERDPHHIRAQNMLFRVKDSHKEFEPDFYSTFENFVSRYAEDYSHNLIEFNEYFKDFYEDEFEDFIYEYSAIDTLLEDISFNYDLNDLGFSAPLKESKKGINLTHDRPFSVQTPRTILNKGRYRILFEVEPKYDDEINDEFLMVLDINSRINTVHSSHIVDKKNASNIYSLDLDLLVNDRVSIRLTSFATEDYILRGIRVIPIEPIEYYINYLNYNDIQYIPLSLEDFGFAKEFLNYEYLQSEDKDLINNYFADTAFEVNTENTYQSIKKNFIKMDIYDLKMGGGELSFNTSFLFKNYINGNAQLIVRINKKGILRKALRILRLRDRTYEISLPIHKGPVPVYLLPANCLFEMEYNIEIPEHFDPERYNISFIIDY